MASPAKIVTPQKAATVLKEPARQRATTPGEIVDVLSLSAGNGLQRISNGVQVSSSNGVQPSPRARPTQEPLMQAPSVVKQQVTFGDCVPMQPPASVVSLNVSGAARTIVDDSPAKDPAAASDKSLALAEVNSALETFNAKLDNCSGLSGKPALVGEIKDLVTNLQAWSSDLGAGKQTTAKEAPKSSIANSKAQECFAGCTRILDLIPFQEGSVRHIASQSRKSES